MPAILRSRSFAALSILLAAAVAAAMFAFSSSADAATRSQRVANALQVVKAQKGDPYVYGATGPNKFDCSGLIYYAYRKAGFTNIPRTSSDQARAAHRIPRSQMRKGDLMFFYGSGGVYHVGVYAGMKNGHRYLIHAPNSGERVHRARVWTDSWYAGTLR